MPLNVFSFPAFFSSLLEFYTFVFFTLCIQSNKSKAAFERTFSKAPVDHSRNQKTRMAKSWQPDGRECREDRVTGR